MLNENSIKQSLIQILISQWYTYYYWLEISPYSQNPMRTWFDNVLLEDELKNSLKKLEDNLSDKLV